MSFETVRAGKPVVRAVKLANAEVYRGKSKARQDSLNVGETVCLQTTGEEARLILDPAAIEQRRAAQKVALSRRWAHAGLPGTLIFSHPDSHEVDLVLEHERMHWGRSLQPGDKVTVRAEIAIPAWVRQLRPWRERTQILLGIDGSRPPALTVGQRVKLRLAAPPTADNDDRLPTGLDKSGSKTECVEWLMSSIYCACTMNDVCAGHVFTLAACDSGPGHSCGLAKSTRQELMKMMDQGRTDGQIFEQVLRERGPKSLRPHMLP